MAVLVWLWGIVLFSLTPPAEVALSLMLLAKTEWHVVRPFEVVRGDRRGQVASLTASSLCSSQLRLAMTFLVLHTSHFADSDTM